MTAAPARAFRPTRARASICRNRRGGCDGRHTEGFLSLRRARVDTADVMPGVLMGNAALVDDPTVFEPQSVVYARSALVWDHVDPGLPRFETLPPTG